MSNGNRFAALRTRYEGLVEVYGRIAIGTYVVLWILGLAGSYFAVQLGFEPRGVAETAGTWVATYALHRVTWLPRIALTLVLTPFLARGLGRLRG